jgi:hypothetical protein
MVKDASPVGLVTPAATLGPEFEPRLGRISGWGKKTLAAEVRVRGVFSVGDWEFSPVKSGPACGPCVRALSVARPRFGGA